MFNYFNPNKTIPMTAKIVPIILVKPKSDLNKNTETIATNKIWTPAIAREYPGFGETLIDLTRKKFPKTPTIAVIISKIKTYLLIKKL